MKSSRGQGDMGDTEDVRQRNVSPVGCDGALKYNTAYVCHMFVSFLSPYTLI